MEIPIIDYNALVVLSLNSAIYHVGYFTQRLDYSICVLNNPQMELTPAKRDYHKKAEEVYKQILKIKLN